MCNDGNIDEASLDIVLERRPLLEGGFAPLERLWHFDPRYMALQYPLLFPWGDFGWTQDLPYANAQGIGGANDDDQGNEEHFDDTNEPGAKKNCVTFREWAAYRLMTRKDDGISFLLGRRLLQQAVVDIWASVQLCRLRWVEKHQNKIRSECYQGVFLHFFLATLCDVWLLTLCLDTAGLIDALATSDGAVLGRDVGRIILPSSITG